jgi:hypothetical protein
VSEHVAAVPYRPGKCEKTYRLVIVRKNLSIEKGEATLFPDLRYFFYITTLKDRTAAKVVELANGRCDQENVIVRIPCQIIWKGRRIIYRVLGYNPWLSDFFSTWERIRRLKPI